MSIEQQLEKIMLAVTGLAKDIEELKANKQDKENEYLSKQEVDFILDKAEKSELDIMKEKYESGEYVCVKDFSRYWRILENPKFDDISYSHKYKLINLKHKHILDAYLEDNNVEIKNVTNSAILDTSIWLNTYNEHKEYILIEPKEEYPQFKANENGDVFRFNNSYTFTIVFSHIPDKVNSTFDIKNAKELDSLKQIPYNKEKGLYHKQPVWIKDNESIIIDFYNVIENRTSIHCIGNKSIYDIEPITPEQLKVIPFIWDMYKKLED